MKVEQFQDKHLSQYGYAVLSESAKQIILIDPARNPNPYLRYAGQHGAEIIGVIETHPHADFVSSHLEFSQQEGARIYGSRLQKTAYSLTPFDEGDVLEIGNIRLKAVNTPGHSPDSISVILEHQGKDVAVFTGDTLFVGDCGRPDLRESGEDQQTLRESLARQLYHSLRDKLLPVPDDAVMYPGHGAGSLCGKSLSDAASSTIGAERRHNWSLQDMSEDRFVRELTADLPFIPAYFPYNVALNQHGAPEYDAGIARVPVRKKPVTEADAETLSRDLWIVDIRDEKEFRSGHLPHAVNIMEGERFETWLGSVIRPGESFYLAGSSEDQLNRIIGRSASIGYESQIREAFIPDYPGQRSQQVELAVFRKHPERFTILDVRNPAEVKDRKFFETSLKIPLPELRNRIREIPTGKPIAVHCSAGYRSAIASSLLAAELGEQTPVYDIGESIKEFG